MEDELLKWTRPLFEYAICDLFYIKNKDYSQNPPLKQTELFGMIFKQIEISKTESYISKAIKIENHFTATIYKQLKLGKNFQILLSNIRETLNRHFSDTNLSAYVNNLTSAINIIPDIPNRKELAEISMPNKTKESKIQYALGIISKSFDCIDLDDGGDADFIKRYPRHQKDFVGRSEEINMISECLNDCGYAILSGMGGIGKTTLAYEYLANNKYKYDLIVSVNFDQDIKSTVASIPCNNDYLMRDNEIKYNIKKRKLNYIGEKAIVLIDGLDELPKDCGFLDFDTILEDFCCHFIITTRMPYEEAISVDQLPDTSLAQVLVNQIKKRTTIIPTLEKNMSDLLTVLHNNTMLVELVGRMLDNCDTDPLILLQNMVGVESSYGSSLVNLKKDDKLHKKTIEGHLNALFSLASLNASQSKLIRFFSLLPSGYMVENRVLELFLAPYTQNDFEDLCTLGWLHSNYDEYNDLFHYGIHPLISETLYKNSKPTAEEYNNEICNIEAYLSPFLITYGDTHLSSVFHNIAIKLSGTSKHWNICKSKICIWLCLNYNKQRAYDIYIKSEDKSLFLPEAYQFLMRFSDIDPTIADNYSNYSDYFKSKIECINLFENLITNYMAPHKYENALMNNYILKLKHDTDRLTNVIKTANNKIHEFNYINISSSDKIIKSMLYPYISPDLFVSFPIDVDTNTYITFLQEQVDCKDIKHTLVYNTVQHFVQNNDSDEPLMFYNNMYILRQNFLNAGFIHYVSEFWNTNNQQIIIQYRAYIDHNRNYISRDILVMWLIQLVYMYIECRDFANANQTLDECKSIQGSKSSYLHIHIKISEHYKDCMENTIFAYKDVSCFPPLKVMYKNLYNSYIKIISHIKEESESLYKNNINPNIMICHILNRYCHLLTNQFCVLLAGSNRELLYNKTEVVKSIINDVSKKWEITTEDIDSILELLTVKDDFFDAIENNPQIQ